MSFFKKISKIFLLLVVISSSALNVSAQNSIAVGVVQSPEVYINNLVLDKSVYNSGDKVNGTFDLLNTRGDAVSDVYYDVVVAGDYMENTLANIFYENKSSGPYYLAANESKKITFSYDLPKNLAGDNLGIQIQSRLATGIVMAWKDYKIKIIGENNYLDLGRGSLVVDKTIYSLQAGPSIKSDKPNFVEVALNNNYKSDIAINPKVIITNRAYPNIVVKEEGMKPVVISSGTSTVLKYDLPIFNNPGIYLGQMQVLDSKGYTIAPNINFRYIIQGDIVTIKGVTVDKFSVKKGENVNLGITYTGNTPDISDLSSISKLINQPNYGLNVRLLNQSGDLVGEYVGDIDFNKSNSKSFLIVASDNADYLAAEVTVKNGDQIVLTYKYNFPTPTNEFDWKLISIVIVTLMVVAGLFLMIYKLRKNKKISTLITFFVLVPSLSFSLQAVAFTTSDYGERHNSNDGHTLTAPWPLDTSGWSKSYSWMWSTINANSISNLYPGQTGYITGTYSASTCDNEPQYTTFWTNLDGTGWANRTPNTVVGDNGSGCTNHCGNTRSYQYSHSFTAPTSLGQHYIYVRGESHQGNRVTLGGFAEGYQYFNVVSVPAPVLTASTGSCGGKINLSWAAVPNVSGYAIYKNGLLVTTTTATSYEVVGLASDQFIAKSYFGSNYSASSTPAVSATPSGACLPPVITASCPLPGSIGTVSWAPMVGSTYGLSVNNLSNGWSANCNSPLAGDFCVSSTSSTSYTFIGVPGASYQASAYSVTNGVVSESSPVLNFSCIPMTPPVVTGGPGNGSTVNNGVPLIAGAASCGGKSYLKWDSVTGAEKYFVYRGGAQSTANIRVLVVAGGGGGGQTIGGGGGGGGVIYNPNYTVNKDGSMAVTVGLGGAGAPANCTTYGTTGGTAGSNSVFGTLTAIGGGGGGSFNHTSDGSTIGGSGGGKGAANNTAARSGTINQGYAGGIASANNNDGAGGGGATGVGGNATNGVAGAGGPGFGGYYGGGGGGGARNPGGIAGGSGGSGGGGAGGYGSAAGSVGVLNTGGGGGGGGYQNTPGVCGAGGRGADGIVMIVYNTADFGNSTGGYKTVIGSETFHTFTASGMMNFVSLVASTTATSTVLTGEPNTSSIYTVRARTATGVYSTSSNPISITSSSACNSAVNISATHKCANKIDVAYGIGSDIDTQKWSIVREKCSTSACAVISSSVNLGQPVGSPFTDTGLVNGSWYRYRINATSTADAGSVATTSVSVATTSIACSGGISCSIVASPLNTPVLVNKNSFWDVTSGTSLAGYTKKWTVDGDVLGISNQLGKIFTTFGQKNISAYIENPNADGGIGRYGDCSTTTTVITESGILEQ